MLYFLDIRRIDGNANFKNEFCNCTDYKRADFIIKVNE